MKKFFLIPLLACFSCVMAFANVAQITFSDEREAVDCADLAALQSAIADLPTDGTVATIKLLDDINAGNNVTTAVIKTLYQQVVVLDLNGHDIKGKLTASGARLIFNDEGHLTIDDTSDGEPGTIENTCTDIHDWWRTIYSRTNTSLHSTPCETLHLKRCKIIAGAGCAVCTWGKELIIEEGVEIIAKQAFRVNGGTGDNNSPAIDVSGSAGQVVTINGGRFESVGQAAICVSKSTKARVYINGGTFIANENVSIFNGYANSNTVSVRGGLYSSTPEEFVDQTSYCIINNNEMYEVKPLSDFTNITVNSVEEMKTAFENVEAGEPICVTMAESAPDFIIEETVELPHGSVFIIPEGKNVTVRTGGLFVNEGTTICNGTINVLGDGFFSKPASVLGDGTITGYESALTIYDDEGTIRYDVSNAMQLQFLSVLNSGALGFIVDTVNIMTDINLPDVNFETIAYAPMFFNGNNHKINNLKMSATADGLAFFRYIIGSYIKNITINANVETTTSYAAILARHIGSYSEIDHVTLNGTVRSTGAGFGLAAFAAGLNPGAGSYVWFVNCVNNANVSSASGYNIGAFVGTMTGSYGELGFYNCANNGVISGHNNVSNVIGYGQGAGSVDVEFISYTNNGSYVETVPTAGRSTTAGIKVVGASTVHNLIEDYIDPETYTAVYDESLGKYVAKEAGSIDNTNATTTDWATNTTWTDEGNVDNVVPTEADNVTVNSNVEVNEGTEAVANNVSVAEDQQLTVKEGASLTVGEGLEIAAGATVTVEEGATLIVGTNGITGEGELIVGATEDGGTGVILVDPAAPVAKSRAEASIELIPDAHKVSEGVYKYRYIGIPLYFEENEEFTSANWEREAIQDGESVVSHAKTWNGGWHDVTSISEFVPFKGYALTNESTNGVKYTFKGKLVGNGDGSMNFTYGFNMFANSYTAPINIQTLLNGLSDDVKATIYMFEENKLRTVSKADFAGFRTPKFTVIPSMQAFFVLLDDGTSASEKIDYEAAVFNNSLPNSPLYAPKHQEAPAFNRVRINIAAENGASDEVYLIETADYTNEFENGFDEVKYMNNGLNLYATTAYGRQSTQITNDITGTFIGVQGNGTYTLVFDELVGEEYQIRDLQTNEVVAMSASNTYTFTANGTNDARFVVEPAKLPTALDNVGEAKMFVNNNTLYIPENSSNAPIMIYAANGQLVLFETAQPTVNLNGLVNGVYTVRVANQTIKFVK